MKGQGNDLENVHIGDVSKLEHLAFKELERKTPYGRFINIFVFAH